MDEDTVRQAADDVEHELMTGLQMSDEVSGMNTILDALSEAYMPIQTAVNSQQIPANARNNIMNGITAALRPLFDIRTALDERIQRAYNHMDAAVPQLAAQVSSGGDISLAGATTAIRSWIHNQMRAWHDGSKWNSLWETLLDAFAMQHRMSQRDVTVPLRLPSVDADDGAFGGMQTDSQAASNFARVVNGGVAPRLADRQEFAMPPEDNIDTEDDDDDLIANDAQVESLPGQVTFRRRMRNRK